MFDFFYKCAHTRACTRTHVFQFLYLLPIWLHEVVKFVTLPNLNTYAHACAHTHTHTHRQTLGGAKVPVTIGNEARIKVLGRKTFSLFFLDTRKITDERTRALLHTCLHLYHTALDHNSTLHMLVIHFDYTLHATIRPVSENSASGHISLRLTHTCRIPVKRTLFLKHVTLLRWTFFPLDSE